VHNPAGPVDPADSLELPAEVIDSRRRATFHFVAGQAMEGTAMRRLLVSGLCFALNWTAAAAVAQEVTWRPVASTPIAQTPPSTPIASSNGAVSVKLRRPEPLDSVVPAAFRPVAPSPDLVARGKADAPRPLPTGPELQSDPATKKGPPPLAPPSVSSGDVSGDPVSRWQTAPSKPNGTKTLTPIPEPATTIVGPTFFDGQPFSIGEPYLEDGVSPWESPDRPHHVLRLNMGYLLWFLKDSKVPPLVTTGPATAGAGSFAAPGTQVLFGGDSLDHSALSGGKFTLALSLPRWSDWTWETTYFFLGRRINDNTFASDSFPVLARPITNITNGAAESIPVAFPGTFAGRVDVEDRIRLWGIESFFRKRMMNQSWINVDWLAGYRHLQLEQDLNIRQTRSGLAGAPAGQAGISVIATDHFGTRNQFNGGLLGIETETRWRRWTLGTSYKLSMGNVHQTLDVAGSQVFIPSGATTGSASGILALPSNIGSYSRDSFTVVPELGVKLGLNITERFQIYVGYSFLYFGSVVRPGDQIDIDINRTQVAVPGSIPTPSGAARPVVPFRTTDFWAQGANFGLEFRY
jgi:hypothetical protein